MPWKLHRRHEPSFSRSWSMFSSPASGHPWFFQGIQKYLPVAEDCSMWEQSPQSDHLGSYSPGFRNRRSSCYPTVCLSESLNANLRCGLAESAISTAQLIEMTRQFSVRRSNQGTACSIKVFGGHGNRFFSWFRFKSIDNLICYIHPSPIPLLIAVRVDSPLTDLQSSV